MESWQDSRFGMFVHWGVYAVPAGVYNGKPVPNLGEWIMYYSRIPRADYRKYAADFAKDGYDPTAWTRLAKEAGMKYMVVTAKHHDGFALFDSAVTDWDAVDARPGGKDLLKPLVEECRKEGIPLGFHYSQAQDWWHPGGGAYGKMWDPEQAGSFDDYLNKIAIPQIKELLERYGPVSSFFFDTPVNMNAARASGIEKLLPAATLTNDRLVPGSPGNFLSFENSLPREFFPPGPWELCLSCNDTWGYKTADHNWKAAGDLTRTLVECASRGGNMLLNVGPDADGRIPEPAAKTLREIGGWLSKNGESIYGTRRSPYAPIPWNGGCTARALPDGKTELYLHLYEWPGGGEVRLPGLTNPLIAAKTLADGGELPFVRQGNSWILKLGARPSGPIPVLKVTMEGAPVIQAPSAEPDARGELLLSATAAVLNGTELRIERQPDSPLQNIGYWTRVEDSAAWPVSLPAAGRYTSVWTLACAADSAGSTVAIMDGGRELGRLEVPSTGGWSVFRDIPGPPLDLRAGSSEIKLVPLSKAGLGIMNLRSVTLSSPR